MVRVVRVSVEVILRAVSGMEHVSKVERGGSIMEEQSREYVEDLVESVEVVDPVEHGIDFT